MTEITKLVITAEIDGRLCHIKIPEESKDVLVHMIQSLSGGQINAVRLPESFRLIPLSEAMAGDTA